MTRRTKWVIIAALSLLAYGLAVFWFWYSIPLPYEKPPAPTKSELKIMEKARYKHGDYTQIITAEAIYLERKGKGGKLERVWVVRERRRTMRKFRLTYGAEGNTDYFEGRFFFGKDGRLYTYAD